MSLLYPEAWGRCGWTLLHACSFGVDDMLTRAQKEGMYQLLWSLTEVLPCKKCRMHLKEKLSVDFYSSSLPVFQTKANLTRALNELHNAVNRSLEKAEMTYEEMCKLYREPVQGLCARESSGKGAFEGALLYFVLSVVIAAVFLCVGGRMLRCKLLGQCDCV